MTWLESLHATTSLSDVSAALSILNWDRVPPALVPLLLFALRMTDLTFATTKTLMIIRGRRAAAWILALIQALLFITGISGVLGHIQQPLNLVAYAAGFGAGNVLGITIEGLLAPGHALLRVTSATHGSVIISTLHAGGYGATEVGAHGLGGTVSVIMSYVPRRELKAAQRMVLEQDPEAFMTVEYVRQVRGGWRT